MVASPAPDESLTGAVANQEAEEPPNSGAHPDEKVDKPRWDEKSGELRLGDRVLRKLKRGAPSQMKVLKAFEEAGWPQLIPSPFSSIEFKSKNDTLYDLNRGTTGIEFFSEGDGQRIGWRKKDTP